MKISKDFFGVTSRGEEVHKYTLVNDCGASISVLDLGCAIHSLFVPDREGRGADIVLGFDDVASYEESGAYIGAVVGRYGNRIGKGKFTLDGVEYSLYCNDKNNHLHGGRRGLSHRVWSCEPIYVENGMVLRFKYFSPDGEEGYPGNLSLEIDYVFSNECMLWIFYRAESDKNTILNLTNHAYFNLGGYGSGSILSHTLCSVWDRYVATDDELIPTGEVLPVAGTPFDFSVEKEIGRDFDLSFEPLKIAGGYDHCLLFPETSESYEAKIRVCDGRSGRVMEVYTDRPGVQFYSANFLNDKSMPLKGGVEQVPQTALCLETQLMPDSINHEGFTDCVLLAGEKFESFTAYRFSVDK